MIFCGEITFADAAIKLVPDFTFGTLVLSVTFFASLSTLCSQQQYFS